MSGHSKWSTIKRQKGVADARRSLIFSKLARQIAVAARAGQDPDMNFQLRLAIDRAKVANLPNDNIARAIRVGSGEDKADQLKAAVYEGFGPGHVAIMVQTLTDNSNRTTGDLRSLFSKHGGGLGAANSVSWMFALRGVMHVANEKIPSTHDQLELELIDAGATDVRREPAGWVIESAPADFDRGRQALSKHNIQPDEAGLEFVPTNTVAIDAITREKLFQLFEALEDHPDVSTFASNEE